MFNAKRFQKLSTRSTIKGCCALSLRAIFNHMLGHNDTHCVENVQMNRNATNTFIIRRSSGLCVCLLNSFFFSQLNKIIFEAAGKLYNP